MQLKTVLWNANGLVHHAEEVKAYIQNQKADIIVISETYFTMKSYIKVPKYTIYDTQQSGGTAYGGTHNHD